MFYMKSLFLLVIGVLLSDTVFAARMDSSYITGSPKIVVTCRSDSDDSESDTRKTQPTKKLGNMAVANYGASVAAPVAHKGVHLNEIIKVFDASVERGDMEGVGKTPVASQGKLRAFKNLIITAGMLIEIGDRMGACQQLKEAYLKSDGQTTNKDYITGQATPKLNQMIMGLMNNLGCN